MIEDKLAKRFNLEKNISKELKEISAIIKSKESEEVKLETIRVILRELAEEIVDARTDLIYEDRTGFLGPRFGEEYLEKEIEVCKRYKKDFTIALLDIDFLKTINDQFGHVAGTKTILTVAAAIKKAVRNSDVVCRYGGDEFLIIFTDTLKADAQVSIDRLRAYLAKNNLTSKVQVAVSCGLAQYNHGATVTAAKLIELADIELYREKANRGNPNIKY